MAQSTVRDSMTEALVSFASHMKTREITSAQQEALVLRILDTLGCAILASQSDDVMQVAAALQWLGGNAQCTALMHGKTSLDHAGYLNSFMIRTMDLNDIYMNKTNTHPSDVIAGVLAAAELANKSGMDVLRALATAYHIMLDMSDAVNLSTNGWDYANVLSAATAISAGMLLDLTPGQMAHAISLCVVSGNILVGRSGKLSMWKGLAGPTAVKNGLFAVTLARESVTGPDPVFEGNSGFLNRVSGSFSLELNPERDRTNDSYIKQYAATFHIQGAIELALDLRRQMISALGHDDICRAIERIEIDVYARAKKMNADSPDKWQPQDHETADHALPFMSALAFYFGKCGHHSIDDALKTPAVAELAQRVVVEADPTLDENYPTILPIRMRIRAGGQMFAGEIIAPLGHATRPMTREAVLEKFQANASAVLGSTGATEWSRQILDFANLATVGKILNP